MGQEETNNTGYFKELSKGFIRENPIFILCLGLCPTLAVSNLVENAFGMGIAFFFVLLCSNITISLVQKLIPDEVRIPCFIVIIAAFVTVASLLMQWLIPDVYARMSLYINLIVVNCIILGRAEAFASKNNVFRSALDAVGMGVGFTASLFIISAIREVTGFGTFLGFRLIPENIKPITIMILAPGAFFTIGFLMALFNLIRIKKGKVSK
ncbi:MAG: electron transport complex subunit E [Candidatus Aureabacteria bacterium]|nr:electron transport complex subunit E [Candidatus Auribacterota bacterium]